MWTNQQNIALVMSHTCISYVKIILIILIILIIIIIIIII